VHVKFWQSVSGWETDQLLDVARAAERLDFWGVSVPSHLLHSHALSAPYPYTADGVPPWRPDSPWPDPWVLIGAMAAVTQRLRFTTAVYVPTLHDPFTVARLVSTAAVLGGRVNRVSLGAGVGWYAEEYEHAGVPFASRGSRMEEMVPLLRALLSGEAVYHHGTHFDADGVRILPAPAEPVPIYLGGYTDVALRRAARLADGWIGRMSHPYELDPVLARLPAYLREYGREPGTFEIIAGLRGRPSADLYEQYAEAGLTGFICGSWASTSRLPTLDDRLGGMERFAERVISRLR
jgi:probable F420-dependent oxidoreductase